MKNLSAKITAAIAISVTAFGLLLLGGCSVNVDDKDKKNEKVDIRTPFANLKVDSSEKSGKRTGPAHREE